MKTSSYVGNHQVVVFWLGVLTGALIVGFAFFYGMLRLQQYQTAVYRATLLQSPTYRTINTTLTSPSAVMSGVGTKAIGGDGVGL